jgi:hypothetical protein
MMMNGIHISSRPSLRTGRPPRSGAWMASLACAAALLAGGCSDPSPTTPTVEGDEDFVRLTMGAPAPASWEVTGPMVVSGDDPDLGADWASLRSGAADGSVRLTHIVTGNRAKAGTYPRGSFNWYVNPSIDRTGTYHPGDCPRFSPTFLDCVRMRFTVLSPDGTPQAVIDAIPDSVVVVVKQYSRDQIRAGFFGRFNYAPANGAPAHVDVFGDLEVARYGSR